MSDKDDAQRALAELTDAPRPGEVYIHYKGGLYSIVCVSVQEDTLEPLVTYHSNAKGMNWTRTLDDFRESIEWLDGQRHPRFWKVKQ